LDKFRDKRHVSLLMHPGRNTTLNYAFRYSQKQKIKKNYVFRFENKGNGMGKTKIGITCKCFQESHTKGITHVSFHTPAVACLVCEMRL